MIIFHSSVNIICDDRAENYWEPGRSNNLLGASHWSFFSASFLFGDFKGWEGTILEIYISIE